MAEPTPAPGAIKVVTRAIRSFDFDDYGLDGVDPKSRYAEWVPDLAADIVKALLRAGWTPPSATPTQDGAR